MSQKNDRETDAAETDAADTDTDAAATAKRHDQLTTAPKATEADAAPRIDVTEQTDGTKRIDWRDDAEIRPGKGSDQE
jgi:hypothetical protein